MAGLGDSFMLPKPGQETEHLWVLITNPDPVTHEAIMVNVTTQRPHSDTTTILNVGDHPFVQKPSVIFYGDTRIVNTDLLDAAVTRGACPCTRCISGGGASQDSGCVATSPLTPKKIKTASAAYAAAGLT